MSSYKQTCKDCNSLIDRDVRFCPYCKSSSPFGYKCPNCLREVQKNHLVCMGCGLDLYIKCPNCSLKTFVGDFCDHCSKSLMVQCKNKRCGVMQFYLNKNCTACGKKIKVKL